MPSRPPRKRAPAQRQESPLHEVVIETLDDEGQGFARFAGKELRIPGAFPGEKVRFRVAYRGQRRMGGEIETLLERSPDRIKPPCSQERSCLGCPLIAMNYPAQLRRKRQRVLEALARYPKLRDVQVPEPLAARQPLGYRTHAKLVLAKVHGKVRVGLYRRGSHEVVDLRNCPLHHPLINRIIEVVREEIERQNVWVYDARKKKGLLRYLLVRVSPANAQALVTFVTAERNFREVTHALDLYCGIGGIALNLARDAAQVTGIEVVEDAVRNARDNARLNKLQNCRFLAGDAAELLDDLSGEFPPDQVVTVNPPRKGVEAEVLEAIVALRPRTIVYVSCDPETLARDLALLRARNYLIEALQPVDMFPQTLHIENVARLTAGS